MKKAPILLLLALTMSSYGQNKPDYSKIDMMLVRGDYSHVIDTCKQILAYDSLNADINFKLGQAYQNLLMEDKSLDCFSNAANLAPENKLYSFTLAKSYLGKGKTNKAKPILLKLCESDSLNWPYAFYLTSIYMQDGKYNDAIRVYNKFLGDSSDYRIMDKIGYASLKSGDFNEAIYWFNYSLSLNPKNINALKNLAYIYAGTVSAQTGIKLLNQGINIDSTDMDLYARRAAINFTILNYVRALNDYLKILASGDSSVLVLKRIGIGYAKYNQPKKAIPYLLKAHQIDTADLEVVSSLAQNYMVVEDYKQSELYYKTLLKMLDPFEVQIGLNWILLAEVLKKDDQNAEAIQAYLKSQAYRSDNSVYMIVANLYDEKLKDYPKAIRYYELYLNKLKNSKSEYDSDYSDSVRKRIESLKKMQ
jgi:tetratricopeptide (TPR) repeat protein